MICNLSCSVCCGLSCYVSFSGQERGEAINLELCAVWSLLLTILRGLVMINGLISAHKHRSCLPVKQVAEEMQAPSSRIYEQQLFWEIALVWNKWSKIIVFLKALKTVRRIDTKIKSFLLVFMLCHVDDGADTLKVLPGGNIGIDIIEPFRI